MILLTFCVCFSSTSMRTVSTMNRSVVATPQTGTLNSRDIHFSHNTSSSAGSHTLSRSREDVVSTGMQQQQRQYTEKVDVHNGGHYQQQQPQQRPSAPPVDYAAHHDPDHDELDEQQQHVQHQDPSGTLHNPIVPQVDEEDDNIADSHPPRFHYNYYQLSYDTSNSKAAHQNANDNEISSRMYEIERDDNVSHDSYLLSHSRDDSVERELDREAISDKDREEGGELLPELHIDEDKLMREVARGRRATQGRFSSRENSFEVADSEGSLDGLQSMDDDDEMSRQVEHQLELAEECVIQDSSRESTHDDLNKAPSTQTMEEEDIKDTIKEKSELIFEAKSRNVMSVHRQDKVSEDDLIDILKNELEQEEKEKKQEEVMRERNQGESVAFQENNIEQEVSVERMEICNMEGMEIVAQKFVDEIVEDVKKTVAENLDSEQRAAEVREEIKEEQDKVKGKDKKLAPETSVEPKLENKEESVYNGVDHHQGIEEMEKESKEKESVEVIDGNENVKEDNWDVEEEKQEERIMTVEEENKNANYPREEVKDNTERKEKEEAKNDNPVERGRDTRKKSVDTDIPYILTRRHLSPEGILEETVHTSKPKLPPKTLLPQRHHRPSKSPSPTRPLTREEQKAKLDKIKWSLASPISPMKSPQQNSKSPGAKRAFDLVMSKKLPPVDSFSSRDDSLSPSTEQEIIEHIKMKTHELKLKKKMRKQSEEEEESKKESEIEETSSGENTIQNQMQDTEKKEKVESLDNVKLVREKEAVTEAHSNQTKKEESDVDKLLVAPPVLQKRKIIPPKAQMEDISTEEESDIEDDGEDAELLPHLEDDDVDEDLHNILNDTLISEVTKSAYTQDNTVLIKQISEDFPPPPPPLVQEEAQVKPLLQVPSVAIQLPTPEVEEVTGLGIPNIVVRPATPIPPASSPEESPELSRKAIPSSSEENSAADIPPPPPPPIISKSIEATPAAPLSFMEEIQLRISTEETPASQSSICGALTRESEAVVLSSSSSSSVDDLPPPPPAVAAAEAALLTSGEYISSDDDEQVMMPDENDFADVHAILATQVQANPYSVPISHTEPKLLLENEQEGYNSDDDLPPPPPPIEQPSTSHYISSDEEVILPTKQDFADVEEILESHALANPFSVPLSSGEHMISPIIHESGSESEESSEDLNLPRRTSSALKKKPDYISSGSDNEEAEVYEEGKLAAVQEILAAQASAKPFSIPISSNQVSLSLASSASEVQDDDEQELADVAVAAAACNVISDHSSIAAGTSNAQFYKNFPIKDLVSHVTDSDSSDGEDDCGKLNDEADHDALAALENLENSDEEDNGSTQVKPRVCDKNSGHEADQSQSNSSSQSDLEEGNAEGHANTTIQNPHT